MERYSWSICVGVYAVESVTYCVPTERLGAGDGRTSRFKQKAFEPLHAQAYRSTKQEHGRLWG